MINIETIADIEALSESFEIECKLAAGRDGKGELPQDFWESYSALANSYGGDIFLGIRETEGHFRMNGIEHTSKVIDALWNALNNPQKVSCNLLTQQDVSIIEMEGKHIIRVHIPKASRKHKPVYLNKSPMTKTFKRQHSGDYVCSEEDVRRMMAEQVEDNRDNEILPNFGWNDLDIESFYAYRNLYAARMPTHPWNENDAPTFLKNIGAWRKNRETGEEGLTKAGLLMFGCLPSIQEIFPNYMLDYQERQEANAEARWIDRLTLDGSWAGNLFEFYRRVIKKLTSDLKVPFVLKADMRSDDTPIHEALREALVNTLVHADYSGHASILVVKRPDMFGFRNPGLMRIPPEIAIQGGESDCRNRLIHQMFHYVGFGERAGSGIPKIYHGWDSQHWRKPLLREKDAPSEQTVLELRMLNLLPDKVVNMLRDMMGESFNQLPHLEQLILATAATEQTVTHKRMTEISVEHTHDITLALQCLVKASHLKSKGRGRGTVYHLFGQTLPTAEQTFGGTLITLNAESSIGKNSTHNGRNSTHSGESSTHNGESSTHNKARAVDGCLVVSALGKPLIDDMTLLSAELCQKLIAIAKPAKERKRISPDKMAVILQDLCMNYYITQQVLAELLHRKPESLRQSTLKPLVDQGVLTLAFPTTPTHPNQAYTSNLRSGASS